MRTTFLQAALAAAWLLAPALVSGQERDDSDPFPVPPEIRALFEEEENPLDSIGPVQQPTPASSYAKISKHFRFSQGEAPQVLPTPTPIMNTEDILKEMRAAMQPVDEAEIPTVDDLMKAYPAPLMTTCMEDSTKSEKLGLNFPGLENEDAPAFDMLFISSREIPKNYEEAFGRATAIVPFDTDSPNISWSMISSFGVPCLPYRFRIQGNRAYVDQGANALKNYNIGPKGIAEPVVKWNFDKDHRYSKKKEE